MTGFIAIDVETSNADMGSICQIGIAKFYDGKLIGEWSALIDPEDYFDDVNVHVHGIEAHMVQGKPKLPEIAAQVRALMEDTVSVCHTHFDRIAITRAFAKYGLPPVSTSWLDSARVVRRTWVDLAWRGYGLKPVCDRIGYEFKHHDALEDAKAAGFVLLAAMRESGRDLQDWLSRIEGPIDGNRTANGASISRDGNPDGDLYGEVLVFTGTLQMHREVAAELAAQAGCEVAANVTKKTTLLVVGDQDVTKLAGHEKSSKHRKAEELSMVGVPIRILRESDFVALVNGASNQPK